jgi:hypothetical protein
VGKKLQLTLTDEALAILEANSTERKRGEWVSNIIMLYAALAVDPLDESECGTLEQIAARLGAVEKQLRIIAAKIDLPVMGAGKIVSIDNGQ